MSVPLKVCKPGDKGNSVLLLQQHLNENGFKLSEDGKYGHVTEAAVHKFQDDNGLESDGIVGPKTWAKLLPEAGLEPAEPGKAGPPAPEIPKAPIPVTSDIPRKSKEKNISLNVPDGAIKGLDISHYQPDVVWDKVAKEFSFVYLKASEGLASKDAKFIEHRKGAKAAGMAVGAYHFFRPKYSAEAQAEHFCRTMGPFIKGDLPPVCDFEDHGNLSAEAQVQAILKFMAIVEEYCGRPPVLYASPAFINEVDNPQAFFKYPLWIANYGVKAPHTPPPWRKWTFWQNAEQGKVDGIKAAGVDHNWFYGSLEDLKSFIEG